MQGLLIFVMLALARSSLGSLGEQQQHQPRAFAERQMITLDIQGYGRVPTTIALTTYDASVTGFTNGSGHWHAFSGYENWMPTSMPSPYGRSMDRAVAVIHTFVKLTRENLFVARASSA
ncbi:hypothetical protein PR202_ga23051 [Eleusine coracana subsp. coracana]|uniref:rRNA N-glycosidase n=1 Tax=Eleusine coracana subsp. coracana TaxID=191504 RepID=A0AAV5D4P6_ELECO|nr:hypothetical protein PR202_ga23051 [Eleusine coracana subsp. coracana]